MSPGTDGPIHHIVFHHLEELVFVCLILMVKADEYFVSWDLTHHRSHSTFSRSVKSSTSAIFASMRL